MKNIIEMNKYELLELVEKTKDINVLKEIINNDCIYSVFRQAVLKLVELKYDFLDLVLVNNIIERFKDFKDICVLTYFANKTFIEYLNELKENDNKANLEN